MRKLMLDDCDDLVGKEIVFMQGATRDRHIKLLDAGRLKMVSPTVDFDFLYCGKCMKYSPKVSVSEDDWVCRGCGSGAIMSVYGIGPGSKCIVLKPVKDPYLSRNSFGYSVTVLNSVNEFKK